VSLWHSHQKLKLAQRLFGLPCHKVHLTCSKVSVNSTPDILKLLDVKPVQDADELLAVRGRLKITDQQLKAPSARAVTTVSGFIPRFSAALSRYVFIVARWSSSADSKALALISRWCWSIVRMLWTVDNARKGFKAAFILILSGIWPPSTWTITAVAGAAQSLAAGDLRFSWEHRTHLSCEQLDIVVVIYRRRTVNSPGCFELPIAIQGPCSHCNLAKSGWMEPNTGLWEYFANHTRITAFMFLYPDLMIRKHSVKIRFRVSRFIELVTTLWTNVQPVSINFDCAANTEFWTFPREICSSWRRPNSGLMQELSRRRLRVSLFTTCWELTATSLQQL